MGLIILSIVAVVFGVWRLSNDDLSIAGISSVVLGGFSLMICMVGLSIKPFEQDKLLVEYNNDKEYIESVYKNNNLTDSERARAVQLIRQDNIIIEKQRLYIDNFWIGIYQFEKVAKLETFDLSKVPEAKYRMILEKK
jgi:hypothetical protein